MIKSKIIYVYGKVQGVGFRYSALQKANDLNITGFVKNKTNGSVYIEAEGEEDFLDLFVEWCKRGPSWSRVENVVISENNLNQYKKFNIK